MVSDIIYFLWHLSVEECQATFKKNNYLAQLAIYINQMWKQFNSMNKSSQYHTVTTIMLFSSIVRCVYYSCSRNPCAEWCFLYSNNNMWFQWLTRKLNLILSLFQCLPSIQVFNKQWRNLQWESISFMSISEEIFNKCSWKFLKYVFMFCNTNKSSSSTAISVGETWLPWSVEPSVLFISGTLFSLLSRILSCSWFHE